VVHLLVCAYQKNVRQPKGVNDAGDGSIMVLDEHKIKIDAPELSEEELMGGPVRRTSSVDPSLYNSEHYSVRTNVVVKVRPRESSTEILVPDSSSFMNSLTSEDLSHVKGVERTFHDSLEIDPHEVKAALDFLEEKDHTSVPN
jgi:hypothetical protein